MASLAVPVVKAGKGITLDVDTSACSEVSYAEALALGMKVLMNRGMSKITAENYPNVEERKAAALTQAQKNLQAINDGTIRVAGGKAKAGVSGAVMTEARRLAKAIVKESIKENGEKVSHYTAAEITKAANQYIDENPEILVEAKENLDKRKTKKVSAGIMAGIKISDTLVKKAEAKKAASKAAGASAKQAGMVKTRTKGAQATA